MKVIFLDIDGVLNSAQFLQKIDYETTGCPDSVVLERMDNINSESVELLNELLEHSGAELVLSSSWRVIHPIKEMNEILGAKGLQKKLYDVTPRIYWDGPDRHLNERGHEIEAWLNNNDHPEVTSFIIFDDESDMNPYMDRLVKTTWEEGLKKEHIDMAKELL